MRLTDVAMVRRTLEAVEALAESGADPLGATYERAATVWGDQTWPTMRESGARDLLDASVAKLKSALREGPGASREAVRKRCSAHSLRASTQAWRRSLLWCAGVGRRSARSGRRHAACPCATSSPHAFSAGLSSSARRRAPMSSEVIIGALAGAAGYVHASRGRSLSGCRACSAASRPDATVRSGELTRTPTDCYGVDSRTKFMLRPARTRCQVRARWRTGCG